MMKKEGGSKKRARDDSEDVDISDDKRSKQEKNRASARESRRRKQEQLDSLSATVNALKEENAKLRAQIVGTDALQKEEMDKWDMIKRLETMVRDIDESGKNKKVSEMLENFEFKHADYGQERTTIINYHMSQVEKLLNPTETTKMALWSLHQDDDFYKEPSADDKFSQSVWNILSSTLNLSDDQKAKLIAARSKIDKVWTMFDHSNSILKELNEVVVAKNEALVREIKLIKTILSPTQVGEFVLWVASNAACIQLLNRLVADRPNTNTHLLPSLT